MFAANCFVEEVKMLEKRGQPSRWFYGIAILVILFGALISVWYLVDRGIGNYPAMITDAYDEEQHHLSVPGSVDVNLVRKGVYSIYYEINPRSAVVNYPNIMPPAIECSLVSKSTGAKTQAAPDYVETNRYWSKDQDRLGVLIMSLTVDEPDTYTFACNYEDGRSEPNILVALGPNYVWEFLKVAGKISLSLFGATAIFCGSSLMALIIVIIVAIKRRGL
jgi:hypothetical protein